MSVEVTTAHGNYFVVVKIGGRVAVEHVEATKNPAKDEKKVKKAIHACKERIYMLNRLNKEGPDMSDTRVLFSVVEDRLRRIEKRLDSLKTVDEE